MGMLLRVISLAILFGPRGSDWLNWPLAPVPQFIGHSVVLKGTGSSLYAGRGAPIGICRARGCFSISAFLLGDHRKRHAMRNAPSAVTVAKRLYTVEDAALYLGRTVWSVRELMWKGALPVVRVGRRVHLDLEDLNAFILRHKVVEPL